MTQREPRSLAAALVAVSLLPVFGSRSLVSASSSSEVARAVRGLERAAGAPIATRLSPVSGTIAFLSTRTGGSVPLALAAGDDPEVRARAFLESHGWLFSVEEMGQMRLLRAPTVDDLGIEHVRFRQTFLGIPVSGGELGVHLRGAAVVAVHAKLVTGFTGLADAPSINAAQAKERVLEVLATRELEGVTLSRPRLEWFNRGLLENRRGPTRLAWFIEARASALREFFWVDAHDGGIVLRFSQLAHALSRSIYDAASGSALPGTLVRSEPDGATGDFDVDMAYEYLGDTWEFFWSEHGRDSFDNAGGPLVASVDYCPSSGSCPYSNAFWNGSQMVFGEGAPGADDVTAHELTHAVIENTANLFYYMQSGALSESYSDIFGELVDLANGAGTDTAEVRWLLGEDRASGATRNMMTPAEFGDPAWMGDWRFVCDDPGEDGGGVHSNSGVPNHAFALSVDGGSFGGLAVAGIGASKAGKIHYRALTQYLLSASNFSDNDLAVRQSCQDLIGSAGITAADCLEVDKALEAVGMDQPWCAGDAGTATVLCQSDQITSTLFFDDLESGTGNWSTATATSNPVGNNVWAWGHDFATSGSSHLWGYLLPHCDPDVVETTDSSVEMALDVTIPAAGAFLQFAHSFGFENYSEFEPHEFYDGGVIEYSTNGGAGWTDAGALISAGTAYVSTIDDSFGNPLGGRLGFVGDSWGYTRTQFDLASLAGQSVRFRFRIGTDDTTDFCDYGWFVDDVRLFECPAACAALPKSGCLECSSGLVLAGGGAIDRTETHVGCDSITVGPDFGVGATGDVRLIAPEVDLRDGFFVEDGGRLEIRVE